MSKDKSKVKEQEVAGQVSVLMIDDDELKAELAERAQRGKWQMLFRAIDADGKARRVSGLTRGQISALYRAASVAGLKTKTSIKRGTVIVFRE